jgi:hypothetical protein
MSDPTQSPTSDRASLDVWLMVNEDGEYVATHDEDNLTELYDDCVGGAPANCRTVHLSLSVPLPRAIDASAELPDDAQPGASLALTVEG